MATQAVISTQPQRVIVVQQQKGQWQTGLFDCFSDKGVCLCGIFCPFCLGCKVAADMDECCLCGSSMAMRALYRTKYNIPGSLCSDFLITYFFGPCALCQIERDINRRKISGLF